MQPKVEDLRKKAFVLYQGMDGVERVNHEVKKMGTEEDKFNEYELKMCLNSIIKNVFIDYVGLERAKEALAADVIHVPGYHRTVEEEREKTTILERIQFMKLFVRLVVLAFILLIAGAVYYVTSIDKVEACEMKKDIGGKDMCFLALALKEGNITFCDRLSSQPKAYNCYSSVGTKFSDIGVCKLIPGEIADFMAMHDKCIMCVAFNLKNRSMCTSFMSPMKQMECESQLERDYSLVCESR